MGSRFVIFSLTLSSLLCLYIVFAEPAAGGPVIGRKLQMSQLTCKGCKPEVQALIKKLSAYKQKQLQGALLVEGKKDEELLPPDAAWYLGKRSAPVVAEFPGNYDVDSFRPMWL